MPPDPTAPLHTTIADLRHDLSAARRAIHKALFLNGSDDGNDAEVNAILASALRGRVTIAAHPPSAYAAALTSPAMEAGTAMHQELERERLDDKHHGHRLAQLLAALRNRAAVGFGDVAVLDWVLKNYHLIPRLGVEPLTPPIKGLPT